MKTKHWIGYSLFALTLLLSATTLLAAKLPPHKTRPPHTATLTDPTYQWHTFYPTGKIGLNTLWGLDLDNTGNLYLAGKSALTWNGDNGITATHPYSGSDDLLVMKLNSAGAYQWHSFYGTAHLDQAHDIAVDADGNAYVTGWSYDPWPSPGNTTPLTDSGSVLLLKINNAGVYQWHSYSGSRLQVGNAIDIDNAGNLYIAMAYSGALEAEKLNPGQTIQWQKVFSNENVDHEARSLKVAPDGSVYIAGWSTASWAGPQGQAPLHPHSGGVDLTIVKLNSAGTYQWHTFYPSDDTFSGLGMQLDLDAVGNLYLAGYSLAAWQGDNNTAPRHPHSGGSDLLILKLDPQGAYQWHTFYGSAADDYGYALAIKDARLYVTGVSPDSWTGDNNQSPVHPYTAGDDAVILRLDTDGRYQWHAFYGGSSMDEGRALAVDTDGDLYIAGASRTAWNGNAGAAPLHPFSEGAGDLFILKLRDTVTIHLSLAAPVIPLTVFDPVVVTATVQNELASPTGTVTFTLQGQPPVTIPLDGTGIAVYTHTPLLPGSYPITAEYQTLIRTLTLDVVGHSVYLPLILRKAQP